MIFSWNVIMKWEAFSKLLMIIPWPLKCIRKCYLKIEITEIAWYLFQTSLWNIISMKEHWSICSTARNAFLRILPSHMVIVLLFSEFTLPLQISLIPFPNQLQMKQLLMNRMKNKSRLVTFNQSNLNFLLQCLSLKS